MPGWNQLDRIKSREYKCGYCGNQVASVVGWRNLSKGPPGYDTGVIAICPGCNRPTYFAGSSQIPGPLPAEDVAGLSESVGTLYAEARGCMSIGAWTAAVMACRKILMNVAVDKGAAAGLSFKQYVDHLVAGEILPTAAKPWVDNIRDAGNEANHEIKIAQQHEAERILDFTEMLLKIVYEYPAKAAPKA